MALERVSNIFAGVSAYRATVRALIRLTANHARARVASREARKRELIETRLALGFAHGSRTRRKRGHGMTYTAKPVRVKAYQIAEILPWDAADGRRPLKLDDGQVVRAHAGMLARIAPQVGDFWVVQEDGYTYLNPRLVFLRKYEPAFPA